MSIFTLVRALMRKHPDLYSEKPVAYSNRHKLVLTVKSILSRDVAPESVTRAQRKVWSEQRSEVVY